MSTESKISFLIISIIMIITCICIIKMDQKINILEEKFNILNEQVDELERDSL